MDFLKKHWLIVIALIIVSILIWINYSKFQPSLKEIKKNSETMLKKMVKGSQKEDIVEEGGHFYVGNPAKIREHIEKQKKYTAKKVAINKKIIASRKNDSNSTPSIAPSSVMPLKFDKNFKHKNIFKPFYTSYDEESKKGPADLPFYYKGYYWLNNSKVAIIKNKGKIYFKRLGELIDNSDYIVSSISLKNIKIKNIHNSEEFSLVVKGGTK